MSFLLFFFVLMQRGSTRHMTRRTTRSIRMRRLLCSVTKGKDGAERRGTHASSMTVQTTALQLFAKKRGLFASLTRSTTTELQEGDQYFTGQKGK